MMHGLCQPVPNRESTAQKRANAPFWHGFVRDRILNPSRLQPRAQGSVAECDARRNTRNRDFVRITAGSAGAIALASCAEAPPFQASNASPSNPRLPADVLLRAGFLDFLDVTADTTMRRCHHCAQATFVSLREGFGPEGGAIVKALTPLPGIAERGETCGAVIGALRLGPLGLSAPFSDRPWAAPSALCCSNGYAGNATSSPIWRNWLSS